MTVKVFFALDVAGCVPAYFLAVLLIALTACRVGIYLKIGSNMIDAHADVSGFGAFKRSKILTDAIKQAAAE